jgi:hypothetical protein
MDNVLRDSERVWISGKMKKIGNLVDTIHTRSPNGIPRSGYVVVYYESIKRS